jgi:protein disulfide-isomerase-like protein
MRFAVIAVLCLAVDADFYDDKDSVIDLTPETLASDVMGTSEGWFVEFYAPWCGHCQKLVPDYKKAAKNLKDYIKFGAIDADAHKGIGSSFGVNGFPALKMFAKPATMNPYTHKPYREAEDYSGPRTYKGIKTFALNKMPSNVLTVKDGDDADNSLPALVTKATSTKQNIVLLFTSKSSTPPLFKWLSTNFAGRVLFAEIHKDNKELLAKFEVEEFPTVKVLKFKEGTSDYTTELYEGDMLKPPLVEHVEKFAKEKEEPVGVTAVQKLTGKNFEKVVMKSKDAWLVSYYKDTQLETLNKLGEDYQKHGIVRVGAVNCTEEVELCKDGDKGLKAGGFGVFGYGEEKKIEDFWTVDEAKEAVLDSIPNRVMIIPLASQLQGFLMTAQQQKMIPLLLLSKKDEPAPMLKAIALAFEKSVLVGLLPEPDDATKKQFQVKKIPALISMFAVPNPEATDPEKELQFQIAHFDKKMFGGFSYATMAMWAQALVQKIYPENAGQARDEAVEAAADNEPLEEGVVPFVTAENWQSLCLSKTLCAISFLDGFASAEQPEKLTKELEMLSSAQAKAKKRNDPFTFMWADGLCQESFADAFDVQAIKLPTIVAFAPKKSRCVCIWYVCMAYC